MQKRHDDQLWSRLDELYSNGSTFISFGELYHWYNVKRIAKTPWRDIKGRWQELLDEKKEKYADPVVAETLGGITFFFSRKPNNLSDLAK
jgi:hypothetical protein